MQTFPVAQMSSVQCFAQEYSAHEYAESCGSYKEKKKREFYDGRVQ